MNYRIYRLSFSTAVHFGTGLLSESNYSVMADTFFSALCIEANKKGGSEAINTLCEMVREKHLKISDLMPYIGDVLYLPKPFCKIEVKNDGDSEQKKLFKKLKYVPVNEYSNYISGKSNGEVLNKNFCLGKKEVRTNAAIKVNEDTKPYEVGTFRFYNECGLYFILAYDDENVRSFIEELLENLSYQGLGGRVSSGFGKFTFESENANDQLLKLFNAKTGRYVSLSVCMAKEDELKNIVCDASYQLCKRSGFINSETYSSNFQKKSDFYSFGAGACFIKQFDGDIFDVSFEGSHPVYRYAVPLFIEV